MKRKPFTFEERLFSMVRNFVEYGSYGKDLKRAVKRLHSYHSERILEDCGRLFRDYLKAYLAAIDFVDTHQEYYSEKYRERQSGKAVSPGNSKKELEFMNKHKEVPASEIDAMIFFIFDWHHLR